MPVVPRNTISEPQVPRLPQVGMAKPRIAEALGSVAGALGSRAASIGRLASTAGDMIGVLERNYERESAIAGAKYKGEMEKANAISSIGSTLVQTGETIDRIYQRKSQEQADNALTEYTEYLTGTTTGYHDAKTGQRVPGTLESPYSPGNEKDEATGPSIATAKAVKEWMENKDGTYAKMSPAARDEFDRRAARVTQSVMDRAMRAEYDQIQAFRQANDKAAFEADRKLVATLGTDVTPAGNEAWMIDAMAARDAQVMREIGRYQKDPSNMSLSKAEWLGDDVKKYADAAGTQVLETFASDRVDALLLAARNEPDDARREAILGTALATAGMEHDGKRVLAEEAYQKAKLEADGIRVQVQQARAAAVTAAIREAESEFGHLYSGRKTDPSRLEQLKAMLPPEEFARIEQKTADATTSDENAMFDGQLEIYESQRNVLQKPGDTSKDRLMRQIAAMQSPVARARAMNKLEAADKAWAEGGAAAQNKAQAEAEARTASNAALIVQTGGFLGSDGVWHAQDEAQQIDTLLDLGKTGSLKPEEYWKLRKSIADRHPKDADNMKTIMETLAGEIGNEEVASLFALDGDSVVYATIGTGKKAKPATSDDADIGDIEYRWNDGLGEKRKAVVDARAGLVRMVAQNAIEYGRQIQTSGRPDEKGQRQPPMSVAEFVRKSLRPDNPAFRDYSEAAIRLNAARMTEVTAGMERWLSTQEFDAFKQTE